MNSQPGAERQRVVYEDDGLVVLAGDDTLRLIIKHSERVLSLDEFDRLVTNVRANRVAPRSSTPAKARLQRFPIGTRGAE